jgi:hypothetical protein
MKRCARSVGTVVAFALAVSAAAADVKFAQKPKVVRSGKKTVISFAASAPTDAAVAIVRPDGRIVCHLAAGMLGSNAASPFRKGLSQRLEWDGTDDEGKPAPAGCRVRVSLGLKAEFAWKSPLFDRKGSPLNDIGSLSEEEEKVWPKLRTPDGDTVLVPKGGTGILREGIGRKEDRHAVRYPMAADPSGTDVYISTGAVCMNSVWRRIDGRTGKWEDGFRVSAHGLAVSPVNGLIYVRYMTSKKKQGIGFWGVHFLKRMDRTGKPVPFTSSFAGPDGEILLPSDGSAKSFGDGMAFSPKGDLYMLCEQKRFPGLTVNGRKGPGLFVFDGEGNCRPDARKFEFRGAREPICALDESGKETQDVGWHFHMVGSSCGLGADKHGNVYVGALMRPTGKLYPDDLVGSPDLPPFTDRMRVKDRKAKFYQEYTGSVIKFESTGVKIANPGTPTHWFWGNASCMAKAQIDGALWTYVGVSPVKTSLKTCICEQSRMYVDGFGRVFVPQTHRQAVLVLGPGGNPILRVGRYGNASVEMKGDDIRFACPSFVAASDTMLYVADKSLGRVVGVALRYRAEESVGF